MGHPLLMRFCLSVCLLPSPCRWTCKAGSNFPPVTGWCIWIRGVADSGTPWYLSSEASMAGWGRTGAFWPREVVSSVGHTSERSRFSRWEGPNARDHAFQVAFPEPVDPCTKYLRSPPGRRAQRVVARRSEFQTVLSICGQRSGNQMEPGYGRTRKTSLCWRQERSTKPTRGFVTLLMEPQWSHCIWWTA